jgi:hypothetical protein
LIDDGLALWLKILGVHREGLGVERDEKIE